MSWKLTTTIYKTCENDQLYRLYNLDFRILMTSHESWNTKLELIFEHKWWVDVPNFVTNFCFSQVYVMMYSHMVLCANALVSTVDHDARRQHGHSWVVLTFGWLRKLLITMAVFHLSLLQKNRTVFYCTKDQLWKVMFWYRTVEQL